MLAKPRSNSLHVESAFLKKLSGLPQRVITIHTSSIQMLEKVPQILVRDRNRINKLLALLLLLCLLQFALAWVLTHNVNVGERPPSATAAGNPSSDETKKQRISGSRRKEIGRRLLAAGSGLGIFTD
ncbi:MAG TPA: hypothetical protein VKY92_04905 [Verrucomicrobiae bacterium]|nr:hypothetical protein [Verrucomicrobiae bacterium]